jgi:predicted Zn-dependent protease
VKKQTEIKTLLDSLLTQCDGFEASIAYTEASEIATRFAENAVTQNMGGSQERVHLMVAKNGRRGEAATNRLDADALTALVARASDVCAHAPEDPEYMPPPPAQEYPQTGQTFFDDIPQLGPSELADELAQVASIASAERYEASGLIKTTVNRRVLANSNGLFVDGSRTGLSFSTTIHGGNGSGHASTAGESLAALDIAATARKAVANAKAAQNPVDIEPGDYTVVFEPSSVLDMLIFLIPNLDAREAEEGVTAFAGELGKQLFSEKVNLSYEISHPQLPVMPFGSEGLAARRIDWVKEGTLNRLFHDRFWAKEKGVAPDPNMTPLFMTGEDQSVDDLIADCDDGLLVKRLWYVRYVDRKELLLTGMTRDGLYRIKGGKIVGPVKNLRWNESPLTFLKNIEALSRPERQSSWINAVVPGARSREFTFSSKTESL